MITLTTERARAARNRRQNRVHGQCVDCWQPTGNDKARCEPCAAKNRVQTNAHRRAQRAIWKRLGLCPSCGLREPMRGYTQCGVCAEARDFYYERQKTG